MKDRIIRHGVSSIVFLFIGTILGFINGFLLFPRIIGAEIYGFTHLLMYIAAIIFVVGNLGLSRITLKFFPRYKQKGKTDIFLGLLIIILILGIVISLAGAYIFKGTIIENFTDESTLELTEKFYFLIPFFIIIHACVTFLIAITQGILRPRIGVLFNEVISRILTSILIFLFFLDYISTDTFIVLFLVKHALVFIGILIFLIYESRLKIVFDKSEISTMVDKELVDYGLTNALSTMGSQLFSKVDTICIGYLISSGAVGIYLPFFFISKIIAMPHEGLSRIISPMMSYNWEEKNMTKLKQLYQDSALNVSVVSCLIFIGIILNQELIFYILPEEYGGQFYTLLFLCIAQLIHILNGYSGILINYSPRYRMDLFFKMLMVGLVIVTNLMLIPIYGIQGAAIATAISLTTWNLVVLIFNYVNFGIQPFTINFISLFGVAIASSLIAFNIPTISENIIVNSIFLSIIVTTTYTIGILYLKVSKDISEIIKSVTSVFGKSK